MTTNEQFLDLADSQVVGLRVLVAVESESECHEIARCARRLFGDDSHYVVLSVTDLPLSIVPITDPFAGSYIPAAPMQEIVDEQVTHAEDVVHEAADELDHAATRVDKGDPATRICETAAKEDSDVIVLGTHDRSILARLLTRSVCDYVVHHAPCPVLVVRHCEHERAS